jgi:hypothetical protein
MDLTNVELAYKQDQSFFHREFWRAIFQAVREETGLVPEVKPEIVPEVIGDIFEEEKQ